MPKTKIIPSQNYLNLVEKVRALDKRSANWMMTQKTLKIAYIDQWHKPLALAHVFEWSETPQGDAHWRNLNKRLENLHG